MSRDIFSDEYDDFDPFDDDEDGYYDCALGPDGLCGKAGTEECDWICGALSRIGNSIP